MSHHHDHPCTCHLPCRLHPPPTIRPPVIQSIPSSSNARDYTRSSYRSSSPSSPLGSPKRHVHFNLPNPSHDRRRTSNQHDGGGERRSRSPPMPLSQTQPRLHRHQHVDYPPPCPAPAHSFPRSVPTIYIITYGKQFTASITSSLPRSQIPPRSPPIPHLYTLDCSNLPILPATLCAIYSGIAPEMQDVVTQNGVAERGIDDAVRRLLDFCAAREKISKRQTGEGGSEVAMSICCESGTHRSVAMAERIAQRVKEEVGWMEKGEGVRIVCRHVHRVKGVGDAF